MNFISRIFLNQTNSQSFQTKFEQWLNKSLNESLPSNIEAFCFNLFETGEQFGIELIGSERFDENDDDWPCDEIFEPKTRSILIPKDYSGDNWEECLNTMKQLVEKFLQSDNPAARILNEKPVGIGFVDSDLLMVEKL